MLSTFSTWAYDFMVDGIAYNFNSDSTTVSVTYTTSEAPSSSTPSSYTGQVVIPDKVTYSKKNLFSYCYWICRFQVLSECNFSNYS